MTDRTPDYDEDDTRLEPARPSFPSVGGGSAAAGAPAPDAPLPEEPLFSRADESVALDEGEGAPRAPATPVWTVGEPRSKRWRWVVAGVATLAVVALIAGLTLLVGPRVGTPSAVALYAPADTVTYVELRLDLPGDQRDRLISFMGHFPGFADPATFEQKLDDTLNQVLLSSGTDLDWRNDIDPWFGGQLAVFSSTVNPSPGTPPSFTVALTIADRERLEQVLADRVISSGATREEHRGRTIWSLAVGSDAQRLSFAQTDDVLLVGLRVEDVRAALDVRADDRPGLADDGYFVEQLGQLHADRLATFYYDGARASQSMADQIGSTVPAAGLIDLVVDMSAVRVVGEVRAEPDRLAIVSRSERSAGSALPPMPANTTTTLAERMPADSLAYVELRDVGQSLGFLIEQVLAPGSGAEAPLETRVIEQLLGTPPQDFLDFLGDVAVSVAPAGDGYRAGLVATVDDEAIAGQRIERLLAAVRALSAFGGGLTVEEQAHGDAMLTVIGVNGLVPGISLGSIAVTVEDGRLLIGMDSFVIEALDRQASHSLAAQPRFHEPISAVGASNAGITFVDVGAVRAAAEQFLPDGEALRYQTEVRPFIEPLDRLVVVNLTEGSISVGHVFLYVE